MFFGIIYIYTVDESPNSSSKRGWIWAPGAEIQDGRHVRTWFFKLFSYRSDFGHFGVESIVLGRCESDETIFKSLRQTGLPVLAYRVARLRVLGIFTSFIHNFGSNWSRIMIFRHILCFESLPTNWDLVPTLPTSRVASFRVANSQLSPYWSVLRIMLDLIDLEICSLLVNSCFKCLGKLF